MSVVAAPTMNRADDQCFLAPDPVTEVAEDHSTDGPDFDHRLILWRWQVRDLRASC
jgi:hypothetical protein